jgi:hypothetical protein
MAFQVDPIPLEVHETFMELALAEAQKSPPSSTKFRGRASELAPLDFISERIWSNAPLSKRKYLYSE